MNHLTTAVWMPVGQDASLVCGLLDKVNLSCTCCASAAELFTLLSADTLGAAVVSEEALDKKVVQEIVDALAQQPSWSHLPIILLTSGGNSTEASLHKLESMRALGNITLLERPLRKVTLCAAVRSALDSRQRQLETRDHIRQLEETHRHLVQANADLEQFAFVASHDLQEPLRMVNAFTQLLVGRLDATDYKAQQFAEFVRSGVNRMEVLLRDLLHYSRAIHEDFEELHPPLNLGHALEDAIKVLTLDVNTANARISFGPMPAVKGNQTQLSLVFQNLLSNAIKYAKADEVPVIEVLSNQDGGECLVCVQDNGIGFDQKYADRVFDLFQRLENGNKPGTGLGLAISRRIIQRHGGRIWAESEKEKGSCFFFTLPLAEMDIDMTDVVEILLAEDNPADAFLVEEALSLTRLKFHLKRAADGETASRMLAEIEQGKATLSLILLDLNLPKVSGHELLMQVRNSEHLRATPVIMITSSDSAQDRAKTAALNANYYFRKPTDFHDFLRLGEIVETVCRNATHDG